MQPLYCIKGRKNEEDKKKYNIIGMLYYIKKKDKCIMTAAFGGGKATEATSGSISGKIQGIDVKAKRMDTGNLNKKNKTYSDSKIVSDAYCVFTVTISLKGADSKEIYAHD